MDRRSVLLVEDDPQDEKLTLRALRQLNVGNTVDVVRDGDEALAYLFRRGAFADRATDPLPAVVLLDLKLPKLGGLDVLAALRAEQPTRVLPVVILTSSDDDQDVLQSYLGGANSYVRKPVDPGEFARAVAQLGLYWLILNEAPKA